MVFGSLIVTLDGDGQNDPADIPILLKNYEECRDSNHIMVTGHRVTRKDSKAKRYASKFANAVRSRLLRDDNPDTGCALKLFERDLFLKLPQKFSDVTPLLDLDPPVRNCLC